MANSKGQSAGKSEVERSAGIAKEHGDVLPNVHADEGAPGKAHEKAGDIEEVRGEELTTDAVRDEAPVSPAAKGRAQKTTAGKQYRVNGNVMVNGIYLEKGQVVDNQSLVPQLLKDGLIEL